MQTTIPMSTMQLEINVSIQILKSIDEVFEGIADPAKMSNYFISQSTGRMEEGAELTWRFPEFDQDVPVKVLKADRPSLISYSWQGEDGNDLVVEMRLQSKGPDKTVLSISEKGMDNNEKGIAWLKGNTEGWANFCACLKAYLEYGINLRKGAFDYRFETH